MKNYILKKEDKVELVQLEEAVENVGLDEIDFDNGLYIEIPDAYVDFVKQVLEDAEREPETDEEGNELPVWKPTANEIYSMIFPKKYYYIKSAKVLEFNKTLNPKTFNIGESYEDYRTGAYVQLNVEQVHYMLHNPSASIYAVYHLGVMPEAPAPTVEQVKANKLMEIAAYNDSDAVNDFTINGVIHAWFTPNERTDHSLSIKSAKLVGQETLTFAVGNNILQVPTDKAEMMLSAIQLYANACYMVTKQHEIAVSELESVEAIEEYDITLGYPERLNFDLV